MNERHPQTGRKSWNIFDKGLGARINRKILRFSNKTNHTIVLKEQKI